MLKIALKLQLQLSLSELILSHLIALDNLSRLDGKIMLRWFLIIWQNYDLEALLESSRGRPFPSLLESGISSRLGTGKWPFQTYTELLGRSTWTKHILSADLLYAFSIWRTIRIHHHTCCCRMYFSQSRSTLGRLSIDSASTADFAAHVRKGRHRESASGLARKYFWCCCVLFGVPW